MKKSSPIPSALLARVRKEEVLRFKQDYNETNYVLDIIKEAIEEQISILSDKEDDDKLFSDPGYVAKYAHMMGQRRMAKKLLNLFPKKG